MKNLNFKTRIALLAFIGLWRTSSGQAAVLPELPRQFVESTCCPAVSRTVAAHTSAQLTAALADAQFGDEIVLDAGVSYVGPFTLKTLPVGSGWVTLRSSKMASLPLPGTRVSPADAVNMPVLTVPDQPNANFDQPVVQNNFVAATPADRAAHHYRLMGLEIRPGKTTTNWHVVMFYPYGAPGKPEDIAGIPHDIIIDRCYIHANDPRTLTAPWLNGSVHFDVQRGAIVDSYLSDFFFYGAEGQAISISGNPGPLKIVNSMIDGGTEGFLSGGGPIPIPNLIPSDIEIRHNFFRKNLVYRNTSSNQGSFIAKNLLEFKIGQRILISDNLFENSWSGLQSGYAITLTPRSVQNEAPWTVVSDVTFMNNVLRHVGAGISEGDMDNYCFDANGVNTYGCVWSMRKLIKNNLFVSEASMGTYVAGVQLSNSAILQFSNFREVTIDHNNLIFLDDVSQGAGAPAFLLSRSAPNCLSAAAGGVMVGNGFALTDNIATYSVETDCSSDPKDVFSYMQGTIDVDGNVFAAAASQTATLWSAYGHNTTVVPSLGAVGLTPDQFALSPSSPFKAAGPGADLSCFVESAVRNGKPSLYCPVPGVATVPLPPQAPTLSVGPLMPRIYPNPWRSDRHSGKQVIFDNLPSQTTVKIFTASGHLVKELNGTGTIPWNLTNEKGDKVASGVYIYLVTDGQGNKAKGKVALVR